MILEGHKKNQNRRADENVQKLVQSQLSVGSQIVLMTCSKNDRLHRFSSWEEFSPLEQNPLFFANFTFDMTCKLAHVVFKSGFLLPSLNPKISALYELGDHADDDVQKESATRRKIKPVECHYDDCGDDVSQLDLPELVGLAHVFENASETSGSDTSDDLFSHSFFC